MEKSTNREEFRAIIIHRKIGINYSKWISYNKNTYKQSRIWSCLVTWLKQWMNALSHMISFNGFITLIHFYRSGNDFWQLWDLKFEQGISRTYSVSGECVRNNVSRKGQSVEKVDWDVFNFENHLLHLSFTSSYLILLLLPTFSYTSSPTSFYLFLLPLGLVWYGEGRGVSDEYWVHIRVSKHLFFSWIEPLFLYGMCIGHTRSHAKFQTSGLNDLA